MRKCSLVAIIVLATMLFVNATSAALWLPRSLSDHVLFQQGEPIVLWGKAAPGARISVRVFEEGKTAGIRTGHTRADSDGVWRVVLDPMSASFTQYVIEVNGDGGARSIRHVLIGELWLAGGQSNMHLPVRYILGGEKLMKQANRAAIRIFHQDTVDESWRDGVSETPLNDTPNGRWVPANSPNNVGECSAVAYTYALALFDLLNKDGREVPVGVMNTAVGATGIASWTSRDALLKDPALISTLPARWNEGKWSQHHKPWNQATALFNHKIAPLTNHVVRGFLWYQGESDANGGEDGAAFYKTALTNLITDWRGHWGGKPRPFILVQLHAYDREGQVAAAKLENWAYLREAQIEAAHAAPQTVAVPIHDLPLTWNVGDYGSKSPIHPLDKMPVGERLALVARGIAYGEPLEFRGPVFKRMIVDGDQAIIYFSQAEGLKARGNTLLGFTVCDSNRRFVEAQARIEGERVIVSSPLVKQPVAVTYAFTSQNHCANLFNRYDLPAAPFRTDKVKSEFLKGCTTQGSEAPVKRGNSAGIDRDKQLQPTNAIVHVHRQPGHILDEEVGRRAALHRPQTIVHFCSTLLVASPIGV